MISISKIMKLQPDEIYPINSTTLEWAVFDYKIYDESGGKRYSWTLRKRGTPIYRFPSRSYGLNATITTFKTLNGAKRNFIKYITDNYPSLIKKDNGFDTLCNKLE